VRSVRDETATWRLRASADVDDMQRLHALSGTRLYCVSTLAGLFPDLGWHQPNEMGGIWAPPIKLLDGVWLGLRQRHGETCWLTAPASWQLDEDGVTRSYVLPALGVQVVRRDWIVPGESVLVIDLAVSLERDPERDPERERAPDLSDLECGFVARSDLHGAWLSETRLGWTDGDDVAEYVEHLSAVAFHDVLHPAWSVCVGATAHPAAHEVGHAVWGPERTTGRGVGAALWYPCQPAPERPASLRFMLAGSFQADEPATALFARYLPMERDAALARRSAHSTGASSPVDQAHEAAVARFRRPFNQCVLRSPDARLDAVFGWTKATADWLMLDVPGLGSGLMAGLPDFPWWFGCDSAFGVQAMLPAGQGEYAAAALRTLAQVSQRHNDDGVVIHEVVTNGVVFWRGNLVEAPLFARALYHTYRWTGDRALLADLFPFCLQGVLEWALGARLEAEEYVPQGESLVETPEMHAGLQTLDVGAYLVEALDLLAALAHDLEQPELAETLAVRAARLRQHLCEDWWLAEDGLFGDIRASRPELRALLNRLEASPPDDVSVSASIERLRRALATAADDSDDLLVERRPWLLRHYLQALAADAGLPTGAQAAALLEHLEGPEWTERHGLVLNATTDRRVMSLPTGALAVGEARYGRPEAALATLQRLAATFGAQAPGTLAEYSPEGGCFLQLWSNYGVVWPIVHYFFGLRPDVATRRLLCAPQLPADWPGAQLRALPLGATQADVTVEAGPEGVRVVVEMEDPSWEVTLGVVVPQGARIAGAIISAAPYAPSYGTTMEAVTEALADTTLRTHGDEFQAQPVSLQLARLPESEGRETWLAPPQRGAGRYALSVSWSISRVGAAVKAGAPTAGAPAADAHPGDAPQAAQTDT